MAKIKFKMKPRGERDLTEQIRKSPLQTQLDERARATLAAVAEQMQGGDSAEILAELVKRITEEGFEPNVARLREVAQAIADGDFQI